MPTGFFVAVIVCMLVVAFITVICKHLWITIKWRLFGWRPAILCEAQIQATIEQGTKAFVEEMGKAWEGASGQKPTDAFFRDMHTIADDYGRAIIDRYIDNFLRFG
jgi:hypothetical protein